MRANITYSVDVDNIPGELSRVVRSEQMSLNTLFEIVQTKILAGYIDMLNQDEQEEIGGADGPLQEEEE